MTTMLSYRTLLLGEQSDNRVVIQDIVTRGAKFLVLYKRPGKRAIVNGLGRLMVSPTLMEASVQQNTAGPPLY